MRGIKNIIRIITIIIFIGTIACTFVSFAKINHPKDYTMIYLLMYFVVIVLLSILKFMPDRIVKLDKIKDKVEYNEFQGIYQELLMNHKEELDKYRKQIVLKRILQGVLVSIFALAYLAIQLGWIVYLDRDFALSTPYIAIGAVVLFILSFFVNTKAETMYRKIYKEKIIGNLIKSLGKDLSYSPDTNVDILNEYKKAEFDILGYNRTEVDDYISGLIDDKLAISMADLQLTRVTGSGRNRRNVMVFDGMFVDITAEKDLGAVLKILTNSNKKHSKLDFASKECEKLEMDSQVFEKHFNVYTDNKIIAMQVLTSEILEMLTMLRETFGTDLEISINNNHIYLRFHTGSMFEARVFGSSINRNDLLIYYGVLKMVFLTSQKINEMILNANI